MKLQFLGYRYISILSLIICLFINPVHSKEISEYDLIINSGMVSAFIQAADCLSIKTTDKEKNTFISGHRLWNDSRNIDYLMADTEFMEQWWKKSADEEKAIYNAIRKYCPETSLLIASVLDEVTYYERAHIRVVLNNIVISVITPQILDKKSQRNIFKNSYGLME